jgi:hypothetical protein
MAALRIVLEEPSREERFEVKSQIHGTGFMAGGGSINQDLSSGGFVILGNTSVSDVPPSGCIEIEVLRHTSPKLPIDLPESGIACAGEVLIRSIPNEEQGSIHIQVVPEGRFSLEHSVVRIGRGLIGRKAKYPMQPDGSCLLDGLGPGPYAFCVEAKGMYRTPYRQVQVAAGLTTEVEMQAYACRRAVFDWKCHSIGSEGGWREGTTTILTGESMRQGRRGEEGCAWGLYEWDGTSANIHGVGGGVLPAEPGDFDPPRVRASREEFRKDRPMTMYPIGVGKVFSVRSFDLKADNECEGVIRIRSIETVVPLATQAAKTPGTLPAAER